MITAIICLLAGITTKEMTGRLHSIYENQEIPDSYILGPGDTLNVIITGSIDFVSTTSVNPSGYMALYGEANNPTGTSQAGLENPSLGQTSESRSLLTSIKVSSMSLKQAEEVVQKAYNEFYRNVKVNLALSKPRVVSVRIEGQVAEPGSYACSATERITDLIVKAKGLTGKPDMSHVIVQTQQDEIDTVNLCDYLVDSKETGNPMLCNIVRVRVPITSKTVLVRGALIMNPLFYMRPWNERNTESVITLPDANELEITWEPGDDVERIITKAGGIDRTLDPSNITIVRADQRMAGSLHTKVEPGDEVELPSLAKHVYVSGEVKKPGAYQYSPGKTYMDYVSIAGPMERGYTKRFTLIRDDGKRVSVLPEQAARPGDRIVVERVAMLWYKDYLYVVSAISSILVTWLVLRF